MENVENYVNHVEKQASGGATPVPPRRGETLADRRHRAYVSPLAVCPLYFYQMWRKIYCDGSGIGCRVLMVYANQEERNKQLQAFCQNDFSECTMYRTLLGKLPQ